MLIEFRFSNHRSILEEQAISFEAVVRGRRGDRRARAVTAAGERLRLLPAAALYGPNAGGKTNVIRAFAFMRAAVLDSFRWWDPTAGVPRDPFRWRDGPARPTRLEVSLLLRGRGRRRRVVTYGFEASGSAFLGEWLVVDGEPVFEGLAAGALPPEWGGPHLHRDNALVLSAATQLGLGPPVVRAVYDWFRRARVLPAERLPDARGDDRRAASIVDFVTGPAQRELFDLDDGMPASLRDRFLDLLVAADVGITGLRVEEGEVLVAHDIPGEPGGAWLPLSEESLGTRQLFAFAWHALSALGRGDLLVVDEPEAHLHPLLLADLVRLFDDPEANRRGAQLLCATHQTSLLSRRWDAPVREDQAWLVRRGRRGTTVIESIAEYDLRRLPGRLDLETAYRQGRFGATPLAGIVDAVARADDRDG